MKFLSIIDILFIISSLNVNLLSGQISQIKFINQLDSFIDKIMYFWNKLPNQIKNSNSVF